MFDYWLNVNKELIMKENIKKCELESEVTESNLL